MMIAAGQERCARRRAQTRRMELTVGQALSRQPLRCRHADEPAVYARPGVADVIQENDDDVGGIWRCGAKRRKVCRRFPIRRPDLRIGKSMLWLRVDRACHMPRLLV